MPTLTSPTLKFNPGVTTLGFFYLQSGTFLKFIIPSLEIVPTSKSLPLKEIQQIV